MKFLHSIRLLGAGFILVAALLYCTDQDVDLYSPSTETEATGFQKVPENVGGLRVGDLIMPPGTQAAYRTSRSVDFLFPEQIKLVQVNWENQTMMIQGSKTYSCSCTGNGCDVVYMIGGDVGCSSCNRDCTGKWVDDGAEERITIPDNLPEVGTLNFFINTRNEGIKRGFAANDLGEVPDNFFSVPLVLEAYQKFLKENYQIEKLNSDELGKFNGLAKINLYGYNLMVKVPGNSQHKRSEGQPSCNCSSGANGCTLKAIRALLKTVGYQCTAGSCTTCNMTIPQE